MMIFKPKQEPLPDLKPLLKKGSQKKKHKNDRWVIVLLFALTVLACLFFYLKAEVPRIWEKLTAPLVISTVPGK